ncbi:MAG: hypothetical protein ACE5GB_06650 [Acidimicrobiales bacterium]
MAGAIVIVVLLVIVLPVATLMSGALGAALLGSLLKRDRDLANTDDAGEPNEHLRLESPSPAT